MFAIYTTELAESRKRRMPWRTVLELAKAWNGLVFSGDGEAAGCVIDGVHVEYVKRPLFYKSAFDFCAVLKSRGVSRLYYPIGPGRSYDSLQRVCDAARIELVWYMTSSLNGLGRIFRAWRWMGFKAVKPYLVQTLIPKRWWMRRLNRRKVRPLITMSDFTASMLVRAGYPEAFVHPVLPGLDPVSLAQSGESANKPNLPYFLFFGPPQPVRGIYLILEAVRRLAQKRRDFVFVPLVRADENARKELEQLKEAIARVNADGEIVCPFYGLAKSGEIESYIDGAVAILKPFVIVPSEIPLAPMEAMQRGKLVIGFDGDGTGELIGRYGKAVRHCDVGALIRAMENALDGKLEKPSCRAESWMTWGEVANKWANVCIG